MAWTTRNTTFSCCFPITSVPEDATNVPIGRPVANDDSLLAGPTFEPGAHRSAEICTSEAMDLREAIEREE